MNEKVDIKIRKRLMTVEMEGMTQLEILTLAQYVEERMDEVERNTQIADGSKLAILTAMEFAAELSRLKDAQELAKRVAERKLEEMAMTLRTSLGAAVK